MFFLPPEVQLDVFKYLNFNQLFSVKQTNFYFRNLVNKYEGELARKEFFELSIIGESEKSRSYTQIENKLGDFEFTLNNQLRKKWQKAIDKAVPLFLCKSSSSLLLYMKTFVDGGSRCYILKLPIIPKTIEEMIIIRCCLEQLFNCAFKYAYFYCLFNPQIINILFDNVQTIPSLQFHVQKSYLFATSKTIENILEFSTNHLSVSEFLNIDFTNVNITRKYTNILFNILINEGNKFPKICLTSYKLKKLYEMIMEVRLKTMLSIGHLLAPAPGF
ncbi:unnamed protein product [Meloidogyne enterolobii]|uniref:Uncharacterized protein n=1 Tax=Meloidogyne enterolobii TaxID=390850 RepID=A0ACB0ZDJ3_MELEN